MPYKNKNKKKEYDHDWYNAHKSYRADYMMHYRAMKKLKNAVFDYHIKTAKIEIKKIKCDEL